MLKVTDNTYEIWLHEDCAVWNSNIQIIGSRIIGLESAVWSNCRHKCMHCLKNGAMISCLYRGCKKKAHVPCAKLNDWQLNDIDFKCECKYHHI